MMRRYWTRQPGLTRHTRTTEVWRGTDLKGPLSRETVRALLGVIRSLSRQSPWPDVDEGWWWAILTDRRLKREATADQVLGRLPVKSLTIECKWCGRHRTVKVDDLIGMFGRASAYSQSGGMSSTAKISARAAKAMSVRLLIGLEDCPIGT
jgi:hypothetical protein